VQIAAREDEVRRWRDTLTEAQRWDWASPSAIFKHCPLFAKGGKGKQPPAFKAIRFEVALDAVLDHLHAMDTDNRRAVIERITGPFRQELGADATELEAARDSEPPAEDWRQEQAADYDKVAAALRFLVPKVLDEQVNYGLDEMVADLMARSDLGFTNSNEVTPLADLIAILIEKLPTLDEEMQAEPTKAKSARKRKGGKRTKAKPRAEASAT
jgi:hypothetical protein